MAVTAKLRIILKAEDTIVAESDDPVLWQKVLASIGEGTNELRGSGREPLEIQNGPPKEDDPLRVNVTGDLIDQFAAEISVSRSQLLGACDPTTEVPFIILNKHNWEHLKKTTPKRGIDAIAPPTLAATLLVIWKEVAGLAPPTTVETAEVLRSLALATKNIARAIKNCTWLQLRGQIIRLNPAEVSSAYGLAKSYCLKKVVDNK